MVSLVILMLCCSSRDGASWVTNGRGPPQGQTAATMLLAAGITIVLNSQKKKPKKETASGKKERLCYPLMLLLWLEYHFLLSTGPLLQLTHSSHSLSHSLTLSLSLSFLSGEIVSKLQSFKHSKMLPSVYPCAPLCYHQYVSTHYWTQVLGMLSWIYILAVDCIWIKKGSLLKLPGEQIRESESVSETWVWEWVSEWVEEGSSTHRGGSGILVREGALGIATAFPFLPDAVSFWGFFFCEFSTIVMPAARSIVAAVWPWGGPRPLVTQLAPSRLVAAATSGSRGIPWSTLGLVHWRERMVTI